MKEGFRDFLWKLKESLTKNKSVLISLGVLLLVVAVGGAVWLGASVFSGKLNDWDANKNTNDSGLDNENTNEATVNLVPRRIDGVLVPENESNFYPVAVIVENLTAARPQSGLDQAQIVFGSFGRRRNHQVFGRLRARPDRRCAANRPGKVSQALLC